MDLEEFNLSQICRTCKCVSSHMRSIFEIYSCQSPSIDEMLMACASVQVIRGDGLPSLICQVCAEQLRSAFVFKHQCETIDASLREYVENAKVNEIKEELQIPVCIEEIQSATTSTLMVIPKLENDYNQFPCRECSEVFSTFEDLSTHKDIHISVKQSHSREKVNVCKIYNDDFEKLYYKVDEEPNIISSDHLSAEETEVVEGMNEDEIKKIEYNSDLDDKSNSESNSTETCEVKVEEEEIQEMFSDVMQDYEDNFDIVNEEAENNYNVKVSNRSKSSVKMKNVEEYGEFPCPVCPKSFRVVSLLEKHAKQEHNGLKVHKCLVCCKEFTAVNSLRRHNVSHSTLTTAMTEKNPKKNPCSECGKMFVRKENLIVHMRRHRGERPFKCKYCSKGFLRKTEMLVHERCHTGEKPHSCTICGKGFGRSSNLTIHVRTHTGEKPYQCTYCDGAFTQSYDLKIHMRRHTGERFQCDLCTKAFMVSSKLTRHKRTVHGLNVEGKGRHLLKRIVSDKVTVNSLQVSGNSNKDAVR